MRIRTAAITAVLAATVAGGALTATKADAQNNAFELLKVFNGNIATLDCGAVGSVLRATDMAKGDTTRSQLVNNLNTAFGADATTKLLTTPTINAVADRALACGVVKADPATPQSQAIEFASKLSADAGVPELRNVLPAILPAGSSL